MPLAFASFWVSTPRSQTQTQPQNKFIDFISDHNPKTSPHKYVHSLRL
ncbi:hypothetical protein SLEP1_g10358 [Rubroshorea leprosula]|uniref:Uncharacterized protein n=1 Tax=Rubroshorea leprosula TaxID=152421 RepID=A0AAV5IH51_9ROSI|nr:hypothetical protein SLEP1_g10358 [Rubroshorea leprosula]